jgi:acylaminoacyl-peptidase
MVVAAPRRLMPLDVFAFRHADDPQIAPDASRVVHVLVRRDATDDRRHATLMLSRDRATWTEIPGSEGAAAPRWAPDSRRLAFLRRSGAQRQLVIHDTDADREIVLLDSTAAMREVAWSPDGTRLAFQMLVELPALPWLTLPTPPEGAEWAPAYRTTDKLLWRHDTIGDMPHAAYQTFVIDVAGGPPRQLTDGIWFSGFTHPPGLTWTHDGRELVLAATRSQDWDRAANDLDIFAVRVADGAVRQLTARPGPTAWPALSPDGAWLAFTGVEGPRVSFQTRRLYLMPMAGGEPRELLPGFDRSIDMVAWDGAQAALLVVYVEHGRRIIARVGLDGAHQVLADDVGGAGIEMPYANGGFSAAEDGTIAFIRTAIDHPGDIAIFSGNAVTMCTDLHADLATAVGGFAGAETIWVTARDGARVQSWLIRPAHVPTGEQIPLILSIHGGPFAQFGERFSIKHQMMAAAGYAVLYVNPRGSTGYGEAFAHALHDAFPGPDYDDLIDTLDVVAARPDIDAEQLFITGISGGGVLTLWAVTHTDRFRAAVSIKPVVNWESWTLTADIGPSIGPVWLGGALPWTDHARLRARSPLAYAADAKTPTMLIAGDADHRTPASEAQQMYAALKMVGVEAALVRAPEVSHSSSVLRPSHFAAEVTCTLAWFARFRAPGPA